MDITASQIISEVRKAIIGKDEVIEKVLMALLAGGHVLLEDVPGVGKTTLAEAFAKAVKEDINPRDSWRASKAFRSHIAVECAKRCLIESVKLAGGEL